MTTDNARRVDGFADRSSPARRLVDVLIALALVIIGVVITGLGGLLLEFADRGRISQLVRDGVIQSDVLARGELIDVSYAMGLWGGLGVLLVGILLIATGVALGVHRYRVDRSDEGGVPASRYSNALLGAVVTVVTSFIPLSGLLGGGVAGYLQPVDRWDGAHVGALAGVMLTIPLLIVLVAVIVGLVMADQVTIGLLVFLATVFVALFAIGVSAIGGYLGAYIRDRD